MDLARCQKPAGTSRETRVKRGEPPPPPPLGAELSHLQPGEGSHNPATQLLDVVEEFNHVDVSLAQPVSDKVVLPVVLQCLENAGNGLADIHSQAGHQRLPDPFSPTPSFYSLAKKVRGSGLSRGLT